MTGGLATVDGTGAGTVLDGDGEAESDTEGEADTDSGADTVPVGSGDPEGAGSVGAGVSDAEEPAGPGVVVSATNAAGRGPLAGSVPGSRSLTSMPDGWPPASVPSAFTTRTWTPSESPVHSEAVPPRTSLPARAASAPSA